jgi:hypothetical protein
MSRALLIFILPPWNPLKYQHRNVFGHQFTHDQNMSLGWQKNTYKFKKVVCEEILRRVRRYSSASKDIPFKTPLFIYSVTTPFFVLQQHENRGNNDQLVKCNFNNTMIRTRYYLLFWMNFVAVLLWLSRSFYLLYAILPSGVS